MKKVASSKVEEKRFFILSSFILEDLFYKSILTIQYTLRMKINIFTIINTYAIEYDFVNEKFAKILYQILEIES